jgi:hypothetical protein
MEAFEAFMATLEPLKLVLMFGCDSGVLSSGADQLSGLIEFKPVHGVLPFARDEISTGSDLRAGRDELLELLRSFYFGVISRDGVDVEGLGVDPARRAGHPVIVGAKGDAEERAYGWWRLADEASAG